MVECCQIEFDLIVTIVNRGFAEEVVCAAKAAGAEGGTIVNGRGTGVHENAKLFGITIEPEKEIVLTLIDRAKTKNVLEAITKSVDLNKPGKGVAFVLGVEKAIGICHLLKE
jgi:nitrogen regulatory protein PII